MSHLDYNTASKLPKGGAVEMTPDHLQASAAESIASRYAMRPEVIYNWANKHEVNLVRFGPILYNNTRSYTALLSDVLNDEYQMVKNLLNKIDLPQQKAKVEGITKRYIALQDQLLQVVRETLSGKGTIIFPDNEIMGCDIWVKTEDKNAIPDSISENGTITCEAGITTDLSELIFTDLMFIANAVVATLEKPQTT